MSMPHDISLILTLTGGLGAALVLGFVTQKLRLSPLVGYLLAGILVGPHSPGFVADAGLASQLAEIGIILLMFGVGLHFHLKDLLAVRGIALGGAAVQITLTTLSCMFLLQFWGFSLWAGAVFGMSVSVASTVVLTRVLADNHVLHTPTGHVALGWLVVEDLFTILLLVLLPVVLGAGEGNIWWILGKTLLKAFVFALTQQDKLPKTILFYNGGAALTCEGSAMLEDLKELEAQGVEILTCGTCLNFYGLTEKLAVGSVTNMYTIAEKLTQAGNVVKP